MKTISIILILVSTIMITLFCYLVKYFGKLNYYELKYTVNNKIKRAIASLVEMKLVLVVSFVLFALPIFFIKSFLLYSCILFVISVLLFSFIIGLPGYLFYSFCKSDIYEKYYINPKSVEISSLIDKRNIIIIYTDSDEVISKNNVRFNIVKNKLTSFLMGIFVSVNNGTPIKNGFYNKKKGFLKKIPSLLDILRKEGYYLEVVSNIDLEKEENYFRNHGNPNVILTDQVFAYSRKEIKNYNRPFCLSMIVKNDNICNFISWFKRQSIYNDTTIFVINSNRVEIINGLVKANSINRSISMFDMFPTILSCLGFEIEGNSLGLGTDLLSDNDTLSEIIGVKEFNKQIYKKSNYYKKNIM